MTRALHHLLPHPHSATVSPYKTLTLLFRTNASTTTPFLCLVNCPLHIRTSLLKAQQWSHATKIVSSIWDRATDPRIHSDTPQIETHMAASVKKKQTKKTKHVTALHGLTDVPATGETGVRLWFFKATESNCGTFLLNYITLPKVYDGRLFDLNNREPHLFDPGQNIGLCSSSRLWKSQLRYSL